ncbi:hypothetical protein FVE85_8848 [Porphyridium purpureum]|uniref:Uncharacterized protein n=1 Tax=Porphyridium purpureum TaxID=35688 RepID=A0A5J4YRJ1_PORPP|nr:hypothetical protein FVE85_8848 [Porphyridium purpureum]|eukprot:POR6215..scf296_7
MAAVKFRVPKVVGTILEYAKRRACVVLMDMHKLHAREESARDDDLKEAMFYFEAADLLGSSEAVRDFLVQGTKQYLAAVDAQSEVVRTLITKSKAEMFNDHVYKDMISYITYSTRPGYVQGDLHEEKTTLEYTNDLMDYPMKKFIPDLVAFVQCFFVYDIAEASSEGSKLAYNQAMKAYVEEYMKADPNLAQLAGRAAEEGQKKIAVAQTMKARLDLMRNLSRV